MNILNELSTLGVKKSYERFKRLCSDTEKTQTEVLSSILGWASACKYGLKHSFAKIANAEEYKNNVPTTSWDDYKCF